MTSLARRRNTAFAVFLTLLLASATAVLAFQVRPKTSRFDALVVEDRTNSLDVATTPVASLSQSTSLRTAWDGFLGTHGQAWSAYLDRRSGAPMLVEGQGIPFAVDSKTTVESLADSLRSFIGANRALLLADNGELVLDRDASGKLTPDSWQISFDRMVAGVPVEGERYVFTIGHGNLISFGAPRWSRIDVSPFPDIDAPEAMTRMSAYMGLNAGDGVKIVNKGSLSIIPLRAPGTDVAAGGGPYAGPVGGGYSSALVWRMSVQVDGQPGTWEALIDAHTGAIRSFVDTNDYAQAKGGVFPVSDDLIPPDGVEQPNWPMPYANITSGTSQTASSLGFFNCDGATASTALAGPYVKVVDTCGGILQSVSCDNDLDLGFSAGNDCTVPAGASAGDTHASRTGFYHLNRIAEHARVWLPTRTWLAAQLTDNVNLNQTCNAYWNGTSVNFFKSGGGCNNTGEIAGVFLHEWGHGLDSNDGGGTDNPGEAYADITAFMSTHVSCVGRGFFQSGNCSGYGDACLNCTGIRDVDYAKHTSNTPATPSGFLTSNCGSGAGPCGKEVHCEGYVGAETLWDLATRDLPASGLDLASSWQLADKLWYKSRLGSGGNAYTCSLPNSDGCAATSWFAKIRTIDDDDGNLANGTPHAAAIYAAFNRHKIACGLSTDASNQSTTTCPSIIAPVLTAIAGSASAQLSWAPVANATAYNILRNDASCAAGSTIIATIPGTTYTDSGLANGFAEYYTVQAVGASAACDGLLSNCQAVTPQPFAGLVKMNAAVYSCDGTITLGVTDANIGSSTTTVTVTSGTEPAGEVVTLTQVAPGSANYSGTILTTGTAPAADGKISVVNGDTITATYIDADDGQGGVNLTRTTAAGADCVFPIISGVGSSNVTGNSATIAWATNEASTSVVHYGPSAPPASSKAVAAPVVAHSVGLTGLSECTNYVYSVESADAVGNTAADNNANSYYTFTTGKNTQPNYPNSDGPIAIPDNSTSGATSTITVPDSKTIVDVNVTIDSLTHTFDGDVTIHLIGPDLTDVVLSAKRGGSGDNFTGTIFDDAAATPIASGTAPFTGSFKPDNPLSAFNGKNAAGVWKLFVVDSASLDTGFINNWTLNLTFPTAACGPHAAYQSFASVSDTCNAGGAGNGNATWDAGETVSFKVTLNNDGTTTLTNVHATVTSTTPGVVMVNGTASYPNMPTGTAADSIAPHVSAYLPSSLPCGGTVSFSVAITSDQGSWSGGTFSRAIGQVVPGGGTALNETFAGGIPATWTIVDGGSGGGAAATWTTANPGSRTFTSPLVAPVAIVDSDNAGSTTGITQDEQMITLPLNLAAATTVTLEFDQYFHYYTSGLAEVGDVDVKSSATAGAWVNVLRQTSEGPNPNHQTLNVTAQAAGAPDVQVRFHYYNGHYEWYWEVDNVKVTYTAPGGCNMPVCSDSAPSTGVAKPVADGSFGTAMKASRADAGGTSIGLTWDVSTCTSTDHHVLYGDLANVASATVSGAVCDLGTTGSTTWGSVPAGDLWFVVVGDSNGTTEGSWGTKTGGERGSGASGLCGVSTRDNTGTCP